MGLDNGIRLIMRQKIDPKEDILFNDFEKIDFDEFATNEYKDGYYYDVCYWRKCWNIREMIFDILDADRNSLSEKYEIDKPSQIQEISDRLYKMLQNGEDWENSIWDFEDMITPLAYDIVNLAALKRIMTKYTNVKVEFYDSY